MILEYTVGNRVSIYLGAARKLMSVVQGTKKVFKPVWLGSQSRRYKRRAGCFRLDLKSLFH